MAGTTRPDGATQMDYFFNFEKLGYLKGKRPEGCILCLLRDGSDEVESLLVHGTELSMVSLNLYPYNPGHLMVVPYRQVSELEDLTNAESAELMAFTQKAIRVIKAVSRPDAFNVGLNLGRSAGGSLAEHLHMHVVPRWSGDANFISVAAETRVLPLSLDEVWETLVAAWDAGHR